MKVRLRKWGNSWAVRLGKKDLERLGVQAKDGKELDIDVREAPRRWDISMVPAFPSTGRQLNFKQLREEAWKAMAEERLARR